VKGTLLALCALILALGLGPHQAPSPAALAQEQAPAVPGPLRLYFLNVGQGDAALLVTPDGVTALIDGGDTDRGDGLVAWLRSMGINSVDWVMPSHPHIDHIAGLTTVLEQMEVRGALVSDQPHTTVTYRRQMQLIADKGIPLTAANDQVVLQLGAFVTAQVLSPPTFLLPTAEPEEDNSVILRVCLVVICTLFTGDIGDQGERYVMARYGETSDALRSQILKVSHHGSAEPNNPGLLAMIRPEVALIGVGAGNAFGHPTQRALDRVGATGATIYRTDVHGTILIEIYEDRYELTLMPEVVIASAGQQRRPPLPTPVPGSLPIGTRTGQPVRYDPNGPDRDCPDFSTWAEAQDFFEAAGGPATDRHRLDSDRNGVACESLPGAPR
jgi:competence protein ComEC